MRQLREAEIEDLDEAVAGDHDVFRFEVPVNDARGMCLREPVGDLRGDRKQLARRERTGIEQVPKRLPLHQLHDEEMPVEEDEDEPDFFEERRCSDGSAPRATSLPSRSVALLFLFSKEISSGRTFTATSR